MHQKRSLTRVTLKTPRAAGIAGIIFSVLLLVIFGLVRLSVPIDPLDQGAWLPAHSRTVGIEVPTSKWSELRYGLIGQLEDHDGEAAQA
jgi:hypothetical protein